MADPKNTLTENDDDKQEDIVIVEDESQLSKNKPADADDEDDGDESEDDDRKVKSADESDIDPEDPDEKEREAIRERRRQEKLERKQRRDEAIKRDKLELDFLRKQNDALERRLAGVEQRTHQLDLSGIDAQIAHANNEIAMAEKVIAKAVEAGNGEDVTQALKYRDQAMARAQQLTQAKQQAAQRPAQEQPAMDDRTIYHAQRFLGENKWYDPQGRDEDSAIVLAIDAALVRDGYDPKTEQYWDELRKRAARRLPERFSKDASKREREADPEAERKPRGGPAVGSGREHAPASTRKEIYISPERKQALIDAGVWDDPILRAKYVRRYAEYDRQNKA